MQYTSLVQNRDFARAYRRGKSYVHAYVVLYVAKNRLGTTRVGITCSKKVGKAVVRNRARRVIRHALYQSLPPDIGGYDLIFVARGQTPLQKSGAVAVAVRRLLEQAGLPLKEAAEA